MKAPFAHSLARPFARPHIAQLNPVAAPIPVWTPARLRHASRRLLGVVLALFALLPGAALLLRADAFAIYCAGLCFVCVAAIVVSAMNRKAVCK